MYPANYYTPNYSGYAPQMMLPQMPNEPQTNITWVQGESAVAAHLVGAGKSDLLMDSERPVFYIKSTDVSGMPQPLRIFDYKERITKPAATEGDYVTRKELEAMLAELKKEENKDESAV